MNKATFLYLLHLELYLLLTILRQECRMLQDLYALEILSFSLTKVRNRTLKINNVL
jgi:hypothetical protein